MKSLMRWMVVAVILTGHAVYAQGVTGTWQGTLNPGKELRVVFIISNANAGRLAWAEKKGHSHVAGCLPEAAG